MEDEVFVRIEDYDDYYVSNLGRVLSFKKSKEYFKKQTLRKGHHYYSVQLCNKDGVKEFLVHRLVAKAFIANPLNLPCINHKDENKLNNRVENLEWCTVKYNTNYGTCLSRRSLKRKKKIGRYNLSGELLKIYDGLIDAEKEGFNHCNISRCINGFRKTYKGYIWKFV